MVITDNVVSVKKRILVVIVARVTYGGRGLRKRGTEKGEGLTKKVRN